MTVITGGAYQGKTDFAKKEFALTDGDIVSGKDVYDTQTISKYKAVSDYEYVVRHNLENGKDAVSEYKMLREMNPEIVIIASEVGCGIIPVDRKETTFREEAGRVICVAAADSDAVYKVVCGIGKRLK